MRRLQPAVDAQEGPPDHPRAAWAEGHACGAACIKHLETTLMAHQAHLREQLQQAVAQSNKLKDKALLAGKHVFGEKFQQRLELADHAITVAAVVVAGVEIAHLAHEVEHLAEHGAEHAAEHGAEHGAHAAEAGHMTAHGVEAAHGAGAVATEMEVGMSFLAPLVDTVEGAEHANHITGHGLAAMGVISHHAHAHGDAADAQAGWGDNPMAGAMSSILNTNAPNEAAMKLLDSLEKQGDLKQSDVGAAVAVRRAPPPHPPVLINCWRAEAGPFGQCSNTRGLGLSQPANPMKKPKRCLGLLVVGGPPGGGTPAGRLKIGDR